MGQIFVIRGFHWGYNDEVYYPCGNYIKSTFSDEAKAQKKCLSLERSHWSDMDLGETGEFFDTDEALIKRVNKFITEKCGKPLFTDDDRRDTFIPSSLNDEDFAEFLKISGLQAFKLTKFDDTSRFYAIYFPDEEDYLKIYDESSTALAYSESIEQLKKESELEYHWDDSPIVLKGELSDLSHSPTLLKALIDKSKKKNLSYQEKSKELKINPENPKTLFSVNELLKKPLFEIKTLTIDEVKELEADLVEEW